MVVLFAIVTSTLTTMALIELTITITSHGKLEVSLSFYNIFSVSSTSSTISPSVSRETSTLSSTAKSTLKSTIVTSTLTTMTTTELTTKTTLNGKVDFEKKIIALNYFSRINWNINDRTKYSGFNTFFIVYCWINSSNINFHYDNTKNYFWW